MGLYDRDWFREASIENREKQAMIGRQDNIRLCFCSKCGEKVPVKVNSGALDTFQFECPKCCNLNSVGSVNKAGAPFRNKKESIWNHEVTGGEAVLVLGVISAVGFILSKGAYVPMWITGPVGSAVFNYLLRNPLSALCWIGFLIFLLTRVFGIAPISRKKKNMLDDLLNYLHGKIKRVGSEYRIPNELERNLKRNLHDEAILTAVARDIVSHCRIRADRLRVQIGLLEPGVAGQYSCSVITLNVATNIGFSKTVAVLIHECMHFYLNSRGFRLEDDVMNEYMTDIAALYMGFRKYIDEGYITAGYLKKNEIRYLQKRISEKNAPLPFV